MSAVVAGSLVLLVAFSAGRPPSATGQAPTTTVAWTWLACVGRDAPCTRVNGLSFPKWLTASPDGRNLYVSAQNSDSVAILSRDPATGQVQQPAGPGGCLSHAGGDAACTTAPGLDSPQGVAISPDGTNVYVAATDSNAITVFARDASSGQLRFVHCLSHRQRQASGCEAATGLAGASFPVVSPDGRNVYVTAAGSQTLTVFQRDQSTGRLTQTGCFVDAATALTGCTPAPGLKQASTATMDPAGQNVYVAARASSAVSTFRRDPSGGALTSMGCISGDRGFRQERGCAGAVGMQYIQYVAPSPDGKFLYAAATDSHAIGVFLRGADGGLTQQALPDGCLQDAGYEPRTPCRPAEGLALPIGMVFTPDGRRAFLAEFGYGTLTAYRRDVETGGLHQVGPCLGDDPRCEPHRTLKRAGFSVLVGDQLFVTAGESNAVNILRPQVITATPTPAPTLTPASPSAPPDVPSRGQEEFDVSFRADRGQSLRTALRRGLAVLVRCSRPCRLSATLSLSRSVAVRHRITKSRRPRGKRIMIGRLRTSLPRRGTVRIRVPFGRIARARLSRARQVPVWLGITAADGAATSRPPAQRVILRRNRPAGA